jgi:hypothetical protein
VRPARSRTFAFSSTQIGHQVLEKQPAVVGIGEKDGSFVP